MNKKYIKNFSYPAYYYRELQPEWLNSILALGGFESIVVNKNFRYLDLGCGRALSLIIAAVNNPESKFVGVDFNEEHIRFGIDFAKSLDLKNIKFYCCDFDSFKNIDCDFFDVIVCHGVWSWVSRGVKDKIKCIVEDKLLDGGLFLLHYMCNPGASELLGTQFFLSTVSDLVLGDIEKKAKVSKELLQKIYEDGGWVNTVVKKEHLDIFNNLSINDLVHEFLNPNWNPNFSIDVMKEFSIVGLDYVTSADAFLGLNYELSTPKNVHGIISSINNKIILEMIKDYSRNSNQRFDIFYKNNLKDHEEKNYKNYLGFKVIKSKRRKSPLIFSTPIGDIEDQSGICNRILDLIGDDYLSLRDIKNSFGYSQGYLVEQSLQLLIYGEYIYPKIDGFCESDMELLDKVDKKINLMKIPYKLDRSSRSWIKITN